MVTTPLYDENKVEEHKSNSCGKVWFFNEIKFETNRKKVR